ncbi:TonB-dependent receptor domain-containing protein [Luteolibacter algae]|uniref:TonB-dependent receptor domain-containing protein n=1 Tax=Luteolibacter algae TaxID=454151 RepID=A0ABW5D3G2_9BACT
MVIEPDLIKQVEVSSGAGNALQGLGALNGSLQFETKNAFDLIGEGEDFYGLSKGMYYSNGEGYRFSQTLASRLGENWAILLSGGYTDKDDYEDGNGDNVDLTDYSSESFLMKLSGRFDGGHSLDVGFEHVLSDTFAYDRLNVTEDFLNSSGRPTGVLQRNEISRDTFSATYRFTPGNNPLVDLKANTYFTGQEYTRETTGENALLETFGISVRNTSMFTDTFSSTYGFDFKSTESDVTSVAYGVTGASEEELAYGFFLQNDWQFHRMFGLSFGGRFDVYDFEDITGTDNDSSEFSPNVALEFKPVEEFTLTAGYAEAYRGVGIREAFFPAAKPAGLSGEDAETFKITAAFERDGFFADASYFDQTIENYIYPIGGATSYGDVMNDGYEARVGYQKDGFLVSLSVTENNPEVEGYAYLDDTGMVVAGRQWITQASYNHQESGLTFGGNIEYREEVEEIPFGRFPAVAAKDSYFLVNTFIRWDVKQVEGLSLSLNVDNIFNEQYQDHTIFTDSGFASAGREFRIGAAYEF